MDLLLLIKQAKSVKIEKDIGEGCGDAVAKVLPALPSKWLHAVKNGVTWNQEI